MGNFCVFPGGHHLVNDYARSVGPERVASEGVPQLQGLAAPVQLHVNSGDVVLAHHCLPHTIAPNWGPHTRHAVYFRLFEQGHAARSYRPESMVDLWLEYPAMWPIVQQYEGPRW